MSASLYRIALIVMALGAALFVHAAVAADLPTSLLALFSRIPKSPATTQEADKMVNANQQIPALVALKADLEAHAATVEPIVGAADAKIRARMGGASTPEEANQRMSKGAAAAGIDVARMQNDKAYAQEMQAKMKAMSPQELMAMSTAMQQGMGMRGTVAVYDPPAVKAAADAGQALLQPEQRTARAAVYDRRWAEVARKVAALNAKHTADAAKHPRRVMCDGEGGGGKECQTAAAHWVTATLPQLMQLLYARDAEVLRVEAAAIEEERTALAAQVRTADQHLLAAQYGAVSQELGNPMHILMLDQTIVGEISAFATKFEDVVKRAAYATHCGPKVYDYGASCYGKQ